MSRNNVIWIMIVCCVIVCLMGFNYAGYTDSISIMQKASTANMNYTFRADEKTLNISFDSGTALLLLDMDREESYDFVYSVKEEDSKNVPLKKIKNQYIGSVNITRSSLGCSLDSVEIEPSEGILSCVPVSLGIFDCYHDFDGVNGTITLVKKTERTILKATINRSELSDEELLQLGLPIMENDVLPETQENSENNEEAIEKSGDKASAKTEKTIEKSQENNTGETSEESVEPIQIDLEGKYGFELLLNYDQYNVTTE